jgi:transcriptional regulator GlxA family with amidase domain
MNIVFVVYEGLTCLDLIGPYEVWNVTPGARVLFAGVERGEIRPDSGAFGIVLDRTLDEVPSPDVVVVPGGTEGTFAAAGDERILSWLRSAHEKTRLTTSVCTGSLILGAAGLLQGKRATTHWAATALLEGYGATYTPQRVVGEDRILTAAGVSAGIDMALESVARLVDEETARAVQLAIEYDPQPPFDAGSPSSAGDAVVKRALAALGGG